jgi:myosin heavy subunit
MTSNDEIFIDANSGISVEEQNEILSGINGIAEKNRRTLSEGSTGKKAAVKAKKSGAFFPVLVNAASIIILAAGCFLLLSFNVRKDVQIREGSGTVSLSARALIEEIRRETAAKIASKDREIELIRSRLEDVDAQLRFLYSSNSMLTGDGFTETELLAFQNAYRMELSLLQNERSQILEDSRSRETQLRSQPDGGSGESSTALELERLTREQERAAAIDAQFSGGLAAINDFIQKDQFDQAAAATADLRVFLNTGSFQSIRTFQEKKEHYSRTLDSVEAMIEEIRKARSFGITAGGGDSSELEMINAQLEDTIIELKKTIDAFSSDSSGQTRRLTELETVISSLRETNSALESSIHEKDRSIRSLETEKTELTQTISARDSTIRELQSSSSVQLQQITELDSQINNMRQALQGLLGQ